MLSVQTFEWKKIAAYYNDNFLHAHLFRQVSISFVEKIFRTRRSEFNADGRKLHSLMDYD